MKTRLSVSQKPFWRAAVFCLCLLAAAPAFAGTEAAAPPPSPYTVAVIPFYAPEKIWLLYTPFIQHLKAATNLPWELKLYPDHNSLIEDLCNNRVGIALLGPVPMARANQKCGVKPFLVALGKDGKPAYHSVIVTGDPAVTSLASTREKKFGFFKGSTAAHIVPLKMLKDAGLNEAALKPVFFESQDRIMTALLAKEVSAAGIKETLYRKFQNEPLRALKTSDALPNFAFNASPGLSDEVRDRFLKVLTALHPLTSQKDAAATKAWDDEIRNGFMLPAADYLDSVLKLGAAYQEIMHETR